MLALDPDQYDAVTEDGFEDHAASSEEGGAPIMPCANCCAGAGKVPV